MCVTKPRVLTNVNQNVIGPSVGRPPDDLKDIELKCRVCGEKFDFTIYREPGAKNLYSSRF